MAAANGHLEACKLLLDRGACPNPVDQFGHTPLTYAIKSTRASAELIDLLQNHGAKLPSAEVARARDANRSAMLGKINHLRYYKMAGMSLQVC